MRMSYTCHMTIPRTLLPSVNVKTLLRRALLWQ